MESLKLITAYDHNFEEIGNISSKTMKIYTTIHGFSFETYREIDKNRPPAWSKIRLIIEELNKNEHEYILWIDADACIVDPKHNILDHIDRTKDIHLVNHMCTLGQISNRPGLYLQVERPNTGVLLVRNSSYSLEFMQNVWNMEQYLYHDWWEQAAVHDLLGYNYEISRGAKVNQFNTDRIDRIGWLKGQWNAIPTSADEQHGYPVCKFPLEPIIIHYAGIQNSIRLQLMKKLQIAVNMGT